MGTVIETERLRLRPMRADDWPGLLTVFADRNVMTAFHADPFDETQLRSWIERNLGHQRFHGYGLYTLILRSTGEIIGDCGLEHMTDHRHEAELGYDLRSDMWGQGLATEAATAVRDHALAYLGITRLISLVRAGNLRSRRVAEKVGMALDSTVDRDGVPYWVYVLDRKPRTDDPPAAEIH